MTHEKTAGTYHRYLYSWVQIAVVGSTVDYDKVRREAYTYEK